MADIPSGGDSPLNNSDAEEYPFDHIDGPYRCSDCGTSYRERGTFNEHLVVNHPRISLSHVCSHCGLEQADLEALRRHVAESHRHRHIHMCPRCPSWFREPKAMSLHLERHRQRLLRRTCLKCSLLFATCHKLRDHRSSGHLREYECVVCGGMFTRRAYSALREGKRALKSPRAKKSPHPKKSPQAQKSPQKRPRDYTGLDGKTRRWVPLCSRCGKVAARKLNLDEPNLEDMTAEEISQLLCSECGKGNSSKDELENNEEGLVQRLKEDVLKQEEPKKNEQPLKCKKCTEKFGKRQNPKGHKRVHEEDTEPDLICDKCGKICKGGPAALNKHRKTCGEPVAGPSHAP